MKQIAKINYPKYIIRTIIFRPFNIILYPLLSIFYFINWITTSEESWYRGEYFCGVRMGKEQIFYKKILWWDLKTGCTIIYCII